MALALAGCNSRPESKDIEAALGAVYGCPAFSLQGVKKTNGEPGPQGSYDVAFEYTVAVKGGEAGGVKFMTNWLYLVSEASATRQALAALDRQAPGAPAVESRIQAYDTQVTAELQQLIPCAGPEIDAVVGPLFVSAKEAAASATVARVGPAGETHHAGHPPHARDCTKARQSPGQGRHHRAGANGGKAEAAQSGARCCADFGGLCRGLPAIRVG
jgi:hypothetical protein